MKKIIQIAKLELSLLFYSPIAWLLMIVLFVQMVIPFISAIAQIVHLEEFIPGFSFLTDALFASNTGRLGLKTGIFLWILGSLYLYIPLITMGIISQETSSGTIKLLYSSPVKLSQIVFGKFLSLMVYNLIIIGVMGLFALIGALFIGHFDYPHVLVAMLAAYLLLSAYSAIGIFMSSLTTYQVVAAISTFMVLAFLNYIGNFGQDYDYIRDITYSLSMPSRAERMVAGLLNTRDVIYYLTISGMFLAFTITKLEFSRLSRPILHQFGRYTLILVAGLTVTYITSRQPMIRYYDATDTKVNTIVKATQKILKDMGEEPVEMTEYINALDELYAYGAPNQRIPDIARWEPYLRFKPNIKLKWVYYYDSIPAPQFYAINPGKTLKDLFKEKAKQLGVDTAKFLTPEEIRKQADLHGENGRLVMQLKYKGKTTFLRTFDEADHFPSEAETAAALKRLIVTPPKIVFATDGYQRGVDKVGDRDYKMLFNIKTTRNTLINQGFDLDSISVETNEIPTGIAALVIGDPKVAYSPAAMAKIKKYIAEGGNLMIAGEPGKQSVVNPLLNVLGINMADGTLVQSSRDYSYDLVTPAFAKGVTVMAPGLTKAYVDGHMVSMPSVTALNYEDKGAFNIQPLLTTNAKNSWIKKGVFVLDSAALQYEPKNGDRQGAYPTALIMTRKLNNKEQRIIVSSDADFFSNKELGRNNMQDLANGEFAVGIFSWFANGEFPVDVSRPGSRDNSTHLKKPGVRILQVVYYGVIPGMMLLLGTVLLIRRKRK